MIYCAAKLAGGRNCAERGQWTQAWVRAMDTTVWTQGQAWAAETFDSVNPATSEVIATFPVHGQSEVDAAVERAG